MKEIRESVSWEMILLSGLGGRERRRRERIVNETKRETDSEDERCCLIEVFDPGPAVV